MAEAVRERQHGQLYLPERSSRQRLPALSVRGQIAQNRVTVLTGELPLHLGLLPVGAKARRPSSSSMAIIPSGGCTRSRNAASAGLSFVAPSASATLTSWGVFRAAKPNWTRQWRRSRRQSRRREPKAKYSGIHALRHVFASWCIQPQARRRAGVAAQNGLGTPRSLHYRVNRRYLWTPVSNGDESEELAAAERALLSSQP